MVWLVEALFERGAFGIAFDAGVAARGGVGLVAALTGAAARVLNSVVSPQAVRAAQQTTSSDAHADARPRVAICRISQPVELISCAPPIRLQRRRCYLAGAAPCAVCPIHHLDWALSREALLVGGARMASQLDMSELSERLRAIERVFTIDELAGRGLDCEEIRAYYKQSGVGYRWFHSGEGAMHMALNPSGEFSESGYSGQAKEVERRINDRTSAVLELAAGRGYNLAYLAARRPEIQFAGVDIAQGHIRAARSRLRKLSNVELAVGDFQRLPFADSSFGLVYAVEGLCHATDTPRALAEASRVLRPGGVLVVIDGWRTTRFSDIPPLARRAARLTEQAMSVGMPWLLPAWLDQARRLGLEPVDQIDLTSAIMPNLHRLEGLARRYFAHPRLARLSLRLAPKRLLANAIAGYLMPLNIAIGAHAYQLISMRLAPAGA